MESAVSGKSQGEEVGGGAGFQFIFDLAPIIAFRQLKIFMAFS